MSFRPDSLDQPLDVFAEQLRACVDLIIKHYGDIYERPGHPGNDEAVVEKWFDESLPKRGIAFERVLNDIDSTVMAHPTNNLGTKMYAYVMSGGNHVSIMADLLAAALNQNPAKWHLGPSMTEIEKRVIAWTAEFIGLKDSRGGAIVSGGSAANLTGLTVARNLVLETSDVRSAGLYGLSPLVLYGSTQTHASVEKSVELLGLGSDNYRKIPVTASLIVDTDALRQQIAIDRDNGLRPFCVIGNAGTVNTGAIDPLDTLADIAAEEKLWLHVDGAYGGLAAALPKMSDAYLGLDRADSIALDYHKWLYQPFEVGCTLVRDWSALRRTYHKSAEYLDYGASAERFDISAHHFALSRNAKAFKVWMSFKAYGANRFRDMIEKDIAVAHYLAECVERNPAFELISTGPLAITCFRYLGGDRTRSQAALDELNAAVLNKLEEDGRVFITGTRIHNQHVIRACVINHRVENADMDHLLEVIRDVGAQCE